MKKNEFIFNDYFCGNKISDYGIENGFVDYATLAKSFNAVLNNNIISDLHGAGFIFEQVNGFIDNTEEIEEIENIIEELEEQKEELEENSIEYKELEKRIEELEEQKEDLESEMVPCEIFQYYIISDAGASILEDYTNEIVFYCEEIDMYVWGVTHWGTSWDYVLTDIKCKKED